MYKGRYSEKARKQMLSIFKDNDELDELHDRIINFYEDFDDLPETEQRVIYEKLFMILPDNIVGNMYSWGISDTEVRDSISEYLGNNKEKFSKLTGLV